MNYRYSCFLPRLMHVVPINPLPYDPTTPRMKSLENIVGEGENTGNRHFLPLPTMFSILSQTKSITSFSIPKLAGNVSNLEKQVSLPPSFTFRSIYLLVQGGSR